MIKQPTLVLNISKIMLILIAKETPNLSEIIYIGCSVPDGFIVTSVAFAHFLKKNDLEVKIKVFYQLCILERADFTDASINHIKKLITNSKFPENLSLKINNEYKKFG